MSEPTTDYLHDVTITSPSVDGMRTVVTLDGMPVKGVMAVTLEIAVNKPNRLRLEMAVNGVNADATAQEALTTEPMAAIARQAAIGAAMRMGWPDGHTIVEGWQPRSTRAAPAEASAPNPESTLSPVCPACGTRDRICKW